jgi:hypothetical protein
MYDLNLQRRRMEKRMKKLEASKRAFSEQQAKGITHLVGVELESAAKPKPPVPSPWDDISPQVSDDDEEEEEEEEEEDNDDNDADEKDAEGAAALTAAELLARAERNKRRDDVTARQLRAGVLMDRALELRLKPDVFFMKPYNGYLGPRSYGPAGPPESWQWIRDEIVWQTAEEALWK